MSAKNEETTKKHLYLAGAIFLVVLAGVAAFLTYNYYKNQQDQKKLQQETESMQAKADAIKYIEQGKIQTQKQTQLKQCLDNANSTYTEYLQANATDVKTDANGKKFYRLNQPDTDYVQKKLEQDKNDCYKQFGN